MMRICLLYVLLQLSCVFHFMRAQESNEDYLAFNNRAFRLIENDSFSTAARFLEEHLNRAWDEGKPVLRANVLSKKGILYSNLGDFDVAERYWMEAMRVFDSLGMERQYQGVYSNLVFSYVLAGKEALYNTHLPQFKSKIDKASEVMLYIYLTEAVMLYKDKRFRELLETSTGTLRAIREGRFDSFFERSERHAAVRKRAVTTHEMYVAFALSELGIRQEERLDLLQGLFRSGLENIVRERSLENKVRVRKYLTNYYRDVVPNKDSLGFYLGELELANKNLVSYLEGRSSKKADFLGELLEKEKELQAREAQLTFEANLIRERNLVISVVVFLLVGAALLLYYNIKEVRYRSTVSKKLAIRNRELKEAINRKLALEGMLEHVQDAITMDMYGSFDTRLEGIRNAVTVLRKIKQEKEVDNDMFNNFFEHLEHGVEQVDVDINDLIWANNSQNNNLSSVVSKLRDFAGEIEEAGNGHRIELIDGRGALDYRLPRFWNRQLLLIFKEAINNAFKYSNSDVLLVLRVENQKLTVICQDDGAGFEMETLQRRSGVANMVKRARSINCDLQITSAKGKGTRIVFQGALEESLRKVYAQVG